MKPKTAKMLIAAAIIAAVIAVVVTLRWTSVPKYEITDLSFIKGHGPAVAINNEDHIVGCTLTPDPNARFTVFIWSPEKGRRTIPALEGKASYASDINDKGQVVGYFTEPGQEKPDRAFIWDEQTGLTELGLLGSGSQAHAVNNKGQVVGESWTTEGQRHAFIWDKTNGMRDLGTLGGSISQAFDINEKGQVVGNSELSNGQWRAFIWQEDTGMVDMGTINGLNSAATGISNTGLVIGEAWNKNFSSVRSFGWDQAGGMTELRLPGDTSHGMRMSDSGQAVGCYRTPEFLIFEGHQSFFLWQPERGIVDLDRVLGRHGTDIVGTDINEKGQIVVILRTSKGRQVLLLTPKGKSKKENE